MKIGIAGPVSLQMLAQYVENGDTLPVGYQFAPMAGWIEEFLRREHEVSVFTLDPTVVVPQSYRGRQLTIHIGSWRPRARARALDFFAHERRALVDAMTHDPVDVIHAHWTYEFALAALDSGYPSVVTAHDAPLRVLRYMPDLYRFIRTLMAWRVARKATHMTAVSPHVADHFRQYLRYGGLMEVVPNGFSLSLLAIAEQGRRQRDKNQLSFASVLNWCTKLKNGYLLLRAFQHVRQILPGVRLLMFGTGFGPGEKAEEWARRRGLRDGVSFVGFLPYKNLLLSLRDEADVLIHPSLEESHSMAIIEAQVLGLPVIGGKHSGAVPFTLDYGRAGLLTDVRSHTRLAQAMLKLARDPVLRTQLSTAGRASALARFDVRNMAKAYEKFYRCVLDAGQ